MFFFLIDFIDCFNEIVNSIHCEQKIYKQYENSIIFKKLLFI
jgi:hypothetical protein